MSKKKVINAIKTESIWYHGFDKLPADMDDVILISAPDNEPKQCTFIELYITELGRYRNVFIGKDNGFYRMGTMPNFIWTLTPNPLRN